MCGYTCHTEIKHLVHQPDTDPERVYMCGYTCHTEIKHLVHQPDTDPERVYMCGYTCHTEIKHLVHQPGQTLILKGSICVVILVILKLNI